MAQLLRNTPMLPTPDDPMTQTCVEEFATLLRTLSGVVFIAALEITTGRVLHSINSSAELDPTALSKAVGLLIRCHGHSKQIAHARAPVRDLLMVVDGAHYVLRPLLSKPNVALYLALHGSAAEVAEARVALACAQRAIDASSTR